MTSRGARSQPGGRPRVCAVCASGPTVRSHVLPRALFHDDAGAGRSFVLGGREDGYRVTQSGRWDGGILCERHERVLGGADAYAVDLCRRWRTLRSSGAASGALANPDPALLVDFVLASVWRMAAALGGGRPARLLGRRADLIEGRLFGPGEGCDPPVRMEAFEIDDGRGAPLAIGLLPAPLPPSGTAWHFIVSDIRFEADLVHDPVLCEDAVNGAERIELRRTGLRTIDEVPGLREGLVRMTKPRGRPLRSATR